MAAVIAENAWRLAESRGDMRVSIRTTEAEKKARKAIAEFENTGWWMAFMVAGIIDLGLDLLSVVPIAGLVINVLSLPFVLYMIIFNFRHGKLRAKVIRFLILLVDFIPIISLFWFGNLGIVVLMWAHARHEKNKAQEELAKIAKKKRTMVAYMAA